MPIPGGPFAIKKKVNRPAEKNCIRPVEDRGRFPFRQAYSLLLKQEQR